MMHLKFKPIAFLLPLALWWLALRAVWFRSWISGGGVKRIYAVLCFVMIPLPVVLGLSAIYTERNNLYGSCAVLSIAGAYLHGQAMYPSPYDYGMQYGPVTYLANLPMMLAGAERMWLFLAWVLLALAVTPMFLWSAMRRSCGRFASLTGVAFLMVFAGQLSNNLWVPNGDIWILLFSAVGVWASQCRKGWQGVLLVAVAGAAMFDVKVTTLVAAALPCLLLAEEGRKRWSVALGSFLLLLALAGSLFLLPHISLENYRFILLGAKVMGLWLFIFEKNLSYVLAVLLPVALLAWIGWRYSGEAMQAWWSRRRYFLAGLAIAIVVATVTGSKIGSGPWHLLPFAAPLAFATGELAEVVWSDGMSAVLLSQPIGALCVATVCMLAASATNDTVVHALAELNPAVGTTGVPPRLAEAEVLQIMSEHPGMTLQMGDSDGEHTDLTAVRPLLHIRGNPLIEDASTLSDTQEEGLPVSDKLLHELRSCQIGLWLIPRGGEPFSLESGYHKPPANFGPANVYPDSFREAFFASYRLVDSHYKYYDLWGCKQGR